MTNLGITFSFLFTCWVIKESSYSALALFANIVAATSFSEKASKIFYTNALFYLTLNTLTFRMLMSRLFFWSIGIDRIFSMSFSALRFNPFFLLNCSQLFFRFKNFILFAGHKTSLNLFRFWVHIVGFQCSDPFSRAHQCPCNPYPTPNPNPHTLTPTPSPPTPPPPPLWVQIGPCPAWGWVDDVWVYGGYIFCPNKRG